MDPRRHRHLPAPCRHVRQVILILCLTLVGAPRLAANITPPSAGDPYHSWVKTLTPSAASPFPSIDPFRATYRFGWEGIPAGGAELEVTQGSDPSGHPNPLHRRILARGGPNAVIRRLWNYRALYIGEAGANGDTPSWFHMDESVAKGSLLSDALFDRDSFLACHRFLGEAKPWTFTPLPGVRDLFAAMLLVRSQPLHDGDHLRLTVFPDRNPYLVDLSVAGRDTLTILGKKTPAIRFTIGIQTIQTEGSLIGKLAPHRKFRSGRVWMSDDARRLPLRAEVDVFIGSVFAELAKITPGL